jgi:hypothetical protein
VCASARRWWICVLAYVCVQVWTDIFGECQPNSTVTLTVPRVFDMRLSPREFHNAGQQSPFLSDVGAPGPGSAPSCPEGVVGQWQHRYCWAHYLAQYTWEPCMTGSPLYRYVRVYLGGSPGRHGSIQIARAGRWLQPTIERRYGWVSYC